MPLETTIKNKVVEFITRSEMFTSIDISNAIKTDGLWIKNREVADWLRNNFSDTGVFGDYAKTSVDVCGGDAQATLYHPIMTDPSLYTNRDQRALTPDDVKIIQSKLVGIPRLDTTPDIDDVLDPSKDDDSDIEMSVVIKSKERIKIPGAMVRALKWNVGDRIDPAHIKTHKTLTNQLYVNSDYRVSIPRECINWGDAPVKVILRNGAIEFEKA